MQSKLTSVLLWEVSCNEQNTVVCSSFKQKITEQKIFLHVRLTEKHYRRTKKEELAVFSGWALRRHFISLRKTILQQSPAYFQDSSHNDL